jgi:hypothetical protein
LFCDQCCETLKHLLLGCVYTKELWSAVLRKLNLQHTIVIRHDNIFAWWMRERKSVLKIARAGFDSLFFRINWSIWKERSAKSFGKPGTPPMSLDVR